MARYSAHFFRGIAHAWGRQTVGMRDPVAPSNKSCQKPVNDLLFFFRILQLLLKYASGQKRFHVIRSDHLLDAPMLCGLAIENMLSGFPKFHTRHCSKVNVRKRTVDIDHRFQSRRANARPGQSRAPAKVVLSITPKRCHLDRLRRIPQSGRRRRSGEIPRMHPLRCRYKVFYPSCACYSPPPPPRCKS